MQVDKNSSLLKEKCKETQDNDKHQVQDVTSWRKKARVVKYTGKFNW